MLGNTGKWAKLTNVTLHVCSPGEGALPTPFGFITRIHSAKAGLEGFAKGRQNFEVGPTHLRFYVILKRIRLIAVRH